MLKKLLITLYIVSLGVHTKVSADDLFALSLEELLQVNVVSKSKETINTSPGIVSVYYAQQLQSLGINSIEDILSFSLGLSIDYNLTGSSVLSVRGLSDARNQKTLLLVNGIPYWMPATGDFSLVAIPFAAVQRVEVIRGPASVVYGTNSSAGVINIVTKTAEKGIVQGYVDSSGSQRLSAYYSALTSNGVVDFSIESKGGSGYSIDTYNTNLPLDFSCFCFPLLAQGESTKKSHHTSLYTSYQLDELRVSGQYFEETILAIESGDLSSPTDYIVHGELLAFQNKHDFADLRVSYFSDWNRFYGRREVNNILGFLNLAGDGVIDFDNHARGNTRWRSGVNIDYPINTFFLLSGGVEYERRQTENYKFRDEDGGETLFSITQPPFNLPFQLEEDGSILLIDANEMNELATYVQLKYTGENWQSVIGGRYVDNSYSGSNFSPRFSLVYALSETSNIKLLYGEGFNSPSLEKINARNDFGFPLDVNVGPETTQTFEVSYNHSTQFFNQVFSAYNTIASDLIVTSQASVSNNEQKIYRSGAEYEFTYRAFPWNITGNIAFLSQGNQQDEKDIGKYYQAKWLANLGVDYQFGNHSIGAYILSSSERAQISDYQLLNVHYQQKIKDWQWFATLKNLLNDPSLRPNIKNNGADIIQGVDDANLTVGLKFFFD